jgi:hypothetical protein
VFMDDSQVMEFGKPDAGYDAPFSRRRTSGSITSKS